MERRSFLVACAAACAAASAVARADASLRARFYHRALLVDANDAPVRAASLVSQRNYIFHYPYTATPCFLLNLGKPTRPTVTLKTADARSYQWSGGVGPHQGIVAYSAICTHKLTYPTRQISFISYRPEPTLNSNLSQVIHCCSEHSQFDPAQGARVLAGPAPQPLAAILLEHDPGRDRLFAVGTLGGEMFAEFFAKYAFRLRLERGGDHPKQEVGETVKVTDLEDYCRQQVRC